MKELGIEEKESEGNKKERRTLITGEITGVACADRGSSNRTEKKLTLEREKTEYSLKKNSTLTIPMDINVAKDKLRIYSEA